MTGVPDEQRPTDRRDEPSPTGWSELFELLDTAEAPDDFLDEVDRAPGKHDRDPFDDRRR